MQTNYVLNYDSKNKNKNKLLVPKWEKKRKRFVLNGKNKNKLNANRKINYVSNNSEK